MKRISFCGVLRAAQAIFARLLFLLHSIFAIWGATCVTGRNHIWALTVLCGLFILETVYSIVKRQGREPKWYIQISTTIKTTSVCDGDARSVGGGRGWLAADTEGLAGWPVGR